MRDLFTNLKVSTKLLLSFGLVAVVSLLVGIVGIFNINRLQDMDNELYRYQTLPLLELRVINGAFEQNRAYMRDIILENDPKKVETAIRAMEENSKKIDSSLQVFSQSLLTQAEKKEFEYFSNVLENFGYHREQIVELCKTGNKEFARTVLMNDGPKLSANFSRAIDKLSQMKADSGRQTAELNASRSQAAIGVTGFLIVLAGVLAIGLGIGISRIISVPLVAVAAAEIGRAHV
jgi:methyl-accepting chemotaxis protein